MTRPASTIALSTRTLGQATGVSQAALDVLLSLSRTGREVAIRAWVPNLLPSAVDGISLGPCHFESVSPRAVAKSVLEGDAPPRSLPEHLRLALREVVRDKAYVRRLGAAPNARPSLEVVNGLGAHGVYLAASNGHASGKRAPSLLVVHESPRHFAPGSRMSVERALEIVRGYDYRVFVSQRGRAEWTALGELDPSRSFCIPNCVREQETHRLMARDRKDVRRTLGYSTEQVQVVCVGAVIHRKGQDIVLDALQLLAASHPQVRVDFLGPLNGPFAQSLRARLARSSELGGRARFLGSVNDVYERIYAADVLVLASRAEAFPLSVLEAMALGTCVVASDVDGIAEQVVHDESGLLFASEDADGLAQCLRQMADDPVRRKSLARAARSRYVTEFNRTLQLERWASVTSKILDER
jgi:glycosyltransferase involved in cell wall biosynthesis